MITWMRRLWLQMTIAKCAHVWRPALYYNAPSRYCDVCKHVENISEAEFYAHFGRPSYAKNDIPWPKDHEKRAAGKCHAAHRSEQ
jgi:hypothetical protein